MFSGSRWYIIIMDVMTLIQTWSGRSGVRKYVLIFVFHPGLYVFIGNNYSFSFLSIIRNKKHVLIRSFFLLYGNLNPGLDCIQIRIRKFVSGKKQTSHYFRNYFHFVHKGGKVGGKTTWVMTCSEQFSETFIKSQQKGTQKSEPRNSSPFQFGTSVYDNATYGVWPPFLICANSAHSWRFNFNKYLTFFLTAALIKNHQKQIIALFRGPGACWQWANDASARHGFLESKCLWIHTTFEAFSLILCPRISFWLMIFCLSTNSSSGWYFFI